MRNTKKKSKRPICISVFSNNRTYVNLGRATRIENMGSIESGKELRESSTKNTSKKKG